MSTVDQEAGQKRFSDWTRAMSVIVLSLHFYYFFGRVLWSWNVFPLPLRLFMRSIAKTGLFHNFQTSKMLALGLLFISLLGLSGEKQVLFSFFGAAARTVVGLALYFATYYLVFVGLTDNLLAISYVIVTAVGYLLVLQGGSRISRLFPKGLNRAEIFNTLNETFPQEERLIKTDFSINLPARYFLRGRPRKSWINFVNPRRGILIMGSPGSGKSYFVVDNIIRQLVQKRLALFVYDYKFPDLTALVYNKFLDNQNQYGGHVAFYTINFDDLTKTNRCNPLSPRFMETITDAIESARSLLLSLNRTWVNRQGEFFVESPINMLTAVIWFLRKYNKGELCTLPHAIELVHTEYEKLFTVLRTQPEIATLIDPFVRAYENSVMETLDSQMASLKIPLGRLVSAEMYYVLSGDQFSLDINNPNFPKIFCLGNSSRQQEALAPVLSLYINRLSKVINQKGKYPCALVCDEFATVRATGVLNTIATGRSNNIITVMALQDYSQLKLLYSREEAEVLLNITGNVISGQVSGETARLLSERFGKIMQPRTSVSVHTADTSKNYSLHLDAAIPASRIASLSSGEFVGVVADDPDCAIELKGFHSRIHMEHQKVTQERFQFIELPAVSSVNAEDIRHNYLTIKSEIENLIHSEMQRILNTPTLIHLLVKKI